MQTIIFGDSITFGFEAPGKQRDHKKRWSYKLIVNNPEHDIVVDAVCGRSFVAVQEKRQNTLFDGKDDILRCLERNWNSDRLIVMLGGNDLYHGGVRSVEKLKSHISEFLEVVRKATEWKKDRFEIILVTPVGWSPDKEYKNEFQGDFVSAFKGHDCRIFDIHKKITAPPKGKPDTDGSHLTDKEDDILYELFKNEFF